MRNMSFDDIDSVVGLGDEKGEYLKFKRKDARPNLNQLKNDNPIKYQKVLMEELQKLRAERKEKMLEQQRRPERDFVFEGENRLEYEMKVNSQVSELKSILA